MRGGGARTAPGLFLFLAALVKGLNPVVLFTRSGWDAEDVFLYLFVVVICRCPCWYTRLGFDMPDSPLPPVQLTTRMNPILYGIYVGLLAYASPRDLSPTPSTK